MDSFFDESLEFSTMTVIIRTVMTSTKTTTKTKITAAIIYTDWTPVEDLSSILVGSVASHSTVEELEDTQAPSNVRGRCWT